MVQISHFTVIVFGDDVEGQLAAYDENTTVDSYPRPVGESLFEHYCKLFEEDNGRESDSLEELATFLNDKYGDDEKYEVVDDELCTISTYNPDRYGLVASRYAEGREADQSSGEEVLFEVREDEAAEGLSEGEAVARWTLHVLPALHEGTELPENAGDSPSVAHSAEVRSGSRGVSGSRESTEEAMPDLQEEAGSLGNGSGPRPLHGGSAGLTLSELQHGTRLDAGFTVRAESSDRLPDPPPGFSWALRAGSKWDWYQIGGRWRGYFKPKANVKAGVVGSPGTFDNDKKFSDGIDQAQLGQIDVEGMREIAGEAEGAWWDRLNDLIGELPEAKPWSAFVADIEAATKDRDKQRSLIDKAREEYHAQPRVQAAEKHDTELRQQSQNLRESDPEEAERLYNQQVLGWNGAEGIENYQRGRDACVERARLRAISSYAYVVNGEWHAPGEMGWFGVSTETSDDMDSYAVEFNKLLDELPPETQVTLVDCHI